MASSDPLAAVEPPFITGTSMAALFKKLPDRYRFVRHACRPITPEFAPFLTQAVSPEEMDLPFYGDSYIHRSKDIEPGWDDELIHDLGCPVKLKDGTVAGEVVYVRVYRLKGEKWSIWSADTSGRVSGRGIRADQEWSRLEMEGPLTPPVLKACRNTGSASTRYQNVPVRGLGPKIEPSPEMAAKFPGFFHPSDRNDMLEKYDVKFLLGEDHGRWQFSRDVRFGEGFVDGYHERDEFFPAGDMPSRAFTGDPQDWFRCPFIQEQVASGQMTLDSFDKQKMEELNSQSRM